MTTKMENDRADMVRTQRVTWVTYSDVRALIARAEAMVSDLCHGRREWVMSIPARPKDDPDIVIADALNAADEVLQQWRVLFMLNGPHRP